MAKFEVSIHGTWEFEAEDTMDAVLQAVENIHMYEVDVIPREEM